MARRNSDQLDLLSYRAPRPAKPKRRKLAAVKVKFGPASGTFSIYEDSYYFDILARRRAKDEWTVVGDVDVMGVDVSSVTDRSTEYRVGEYRARLYLDSPYKEAVEDLGDDADEYDVDVTEGTDLWTRSYSKRVIRTAAEAKRMVKEWAAETLEAVAWEG